ncbi:MAG: FecR domain-containing protein [Bacteroidota bacterium]
MNKEKFIQEWIEGTISQERVNELKKDPEYSETIAELETIVAATNRIVPPHTKSKSQAWDEIVDKLEEDEVPAPKKGKLIKLSSLVPIGIAAAVTLILAAYFLLSSETSFKTPSGKQMAYSLPHGTEVLLNAETSLSFDTSNWETNRVVKLEGEAYFKVAEGVPFIVKTKVGSVEVLGTSFNVFNRSDMLVVSCFEGKVKLITSRAKEIILNANQASTIIEGEIDEPKEFDIEKTATWREGEFYYEDVPFPLVVEEFERQYDLKVVYDTMTSRPYTGYFNNKNLQEALKLLFPPMSYQYEKKGSTIVIK